ncbi:hypothetical protein QQP08_020953 [Theobroma cacao]|nr:hypothetical protein QQP08_020953 [Theobroma cacao]
MILKYVIAFDRAIRSCQLVFSLFRAVHNTVQENVMSRPFDDRFAVALTCAIDSAAEYWGYRAAPIVKSEKLTVEMHKAFLLQILQVGNFKFLNPYQQIFLAGLVGIVDLWDAANLHVMDILG